MVCLAEIHLAFPKELAIPDHLVAHLKRCVYGTRDAGAIWEDCYATALTEMGFVRGKFLNETPGGSTGGEGCGRKGGGGARLLLVSGGFPFLGENHRFLSREEVDVGLRMLL